MAPRDVVSRFASDRCSPTLLETDDMRRPHPPPRQKERRAARAPGLIEIILIEIIGTKETVGCGGDNRWLASNSNSQPGVIENDDRLKTQLLRKRPGPKNLQGRSVG